MMEDFSNFIHEELFILSEESSPTQTTSPSLQENIEYKLAVIAGEMSEEENILLGNILSALKLDEQDIFKTSEVIDGKSDRWLIFGESFELKSVHLEFYRPTKIGNRTFVLAQPLTILRESQNEKQNLWSSLKELFGM